MTFFARLFVVGAVAAVLSGCWPAPGAGPDRRSFNPWERDLTPDTVGGLTEVFRAPLADGAGAPVVTPSGLFVRTGLSIAAFEPGTGAARWTTRLPPEDTGPYEPEMGDPFVVDGDTVVASYAVFYASHTRNDEVVTLSADTGAVQQTNFSGGIVKSVRGTDLARIGRELCCYGEIDYTRIGVRPVTDLWRWGGVAYEFQGEGVVTLGVGRLFVSTGDQIFAYDTTTECPPMLPGDFARTCLSQWARHFDGRFSGPTSPVVIGDDDTVFVRSGGGVTALIASSGGIRWHAPLGTATTTPALAYGMLYVGGTDGRLSALPAGGCGAIECPAAWSTATDSPVNVQPAVAGGVVYVGSADGTVRAFDADGCGAATCPALWSVDTGAPVTGGLAVYGGRLYVGTQDALVGYGLSPA